MVARDILLGMAGAWITAVAAVIILLWIQPGSVLAVERSLQPLL